MTEVKTEVCTNGHEVWFFEGLDIVIRCGLCGEVVREKDAEV